MCCRRNSLLITESERTYIKNLYGLLTEADDKNQITLSAKSTFKSGKYSQLSPEGMAELQGELQKATAWMTQNKGSVVFVQIKATESQLTNYDTEQDPKVPVEQKVLSRLRAKTLKRYLTEYFRSLVDSGVLTEMPVFQEPKIDIGLTEYVKGKTALTPEKLAQYETEQNVSVELKLMSPEKCLIDLEIEVKYDNVINPSFPCRGGHTCNDARFDVKLNGISIGVANLNNAGDGGSRTSGVLKIDETKAKQIIGNNVKKITFSLKCLSGQNCHSGTPEVIIKKNGETIYHQCSPAISRGDQNEYPILTLDVCGNVIEKGTGDATNNDKPVNVNTQEVKNVFINSKSFGFNVFYTNLGFVSSFMEKGMLKSNDGKTYEQGVVRDKSGVALYWQGSVTVGKTGLSGRLMNGGAQSVIDLDPGTIINKVVSDGYKLLPGEKNITPTNPLLYSEGSTTSSGKYHVEMDTTKQVPNQMILVRGAGSDITDAEKKQNIVRFKLDDEKITDFENYYIPKKLVEKTADGMYKVIVKKISYVGKTYDQGTILKLEED